MSDRSYDPWADADTDLFAVLGAPWGASPEELREARRKALFNAHPDTGGSHDEVLRLQHAWWVLSDPERRAAYLRVQRVRQANGDQSDRPGDDFADGGAWRARQESGEHHRGSVGRCGGVTALGQPCGNSPVPGEERCVHHLSQSDEEIAQLLRKFGPLAVCKGRTQQGWGCGNRPSEGSDFCWLHGGRRQPRQTGGEPQERVPWRCSAPLVYEGLDIGCTYNRLVDSEHCWDHSSAEERVGAVRQAAPGQCCSLTQRGAPCTKKRSSLGFAVCDSHITLGLFDERA